VKKLLITLISLLLLSSPVIGQSKPLGVVLPTTVMGNVSDTRKQILLNTLDEEISRYFDVSPPTNVSSGDLPVVSDVFQLQIVEEDGDTQLSVRWMSGNERKLETILCGGCKTTELNGKLEELVGKLVRGKTIEPVVIVRKRGDWNYVEENEGYTFYYDKDRVRKSGKYIYFWLLSDFIKPDENGNLSGRTYNELDCSIFRFKILKFQLFNNSMGEGKNTKDITPSDEDEWVYPRPDSVNEFVHNKICEENQ